MLESVVAHLKRFTRWCLDLMERAACPPPGVRPEDWWQDWREL